MIVCSAGVGRTGTYIALDVLLEMAKEEGCIDVFGLAQRMRKERVNMIQTVVGLKNNINLTIVLRKIWVELFCLQAIEKMSNSAFKSAKN